VNDAKRKVSIEEDPLEMGTEDKKAVVEIDKE